MHLLEEKKAGKNPFKFYHYWMNCAGFHDIINSSWNVAIPRYPLYKLICKLNKIKGALKD